MIIPNEKQAPFILACTAEAGNDIVGAYGGAGGGKSFNIAFAAIEFAVEVPGNEIAVVRKVRADIKSTTYAAILRCLDTNLVLGESSEEFTLTLKTRDPRFPSTIHFIGLDKLTRLGGRFFGTILIDECSELREDEFTYLITRLRHELPKVKVTEVDPVTGEEEHYEEPYERPAGSPYFYPPDHPVAPNDMHRIIAFAANPPVDMDHWLDELVWDGKLGGKAVPHHIVHYTTFDNAANLPQSYLKAIQNLPKHEMLRLVYGQRTLGHSGKPATADFDRDKHLFDAPYNYYCLEWFSGIDFGWARPYICWGTYAEGSLYIWDEFLGRCQDLESFLDVVTEKEKFLNPEADVTDWVDQSHGLQHSDKSRETSIEICRGRGRRPMHKYSRPDWRAQAVNTLLRQGRLWVHKRCVNLISALDGGWARDPKTGDLMKDGFYEHIGDGFGYLVWGLFEQQLKHYILNRGQGHKQDEIIIREELLKANGRQPRVVTQFTEAESPGEGERGYGQRGQVVSSAFRRGFKRQL